MIRPAPAAQAPAVAPAAKKEKDTGVPKDITEVLAPPTIKRLRAILGEVSAEVAVLQREEEMDLRFVRWQDGGYVPVKGALNFGDAFFLEGRLKEEAKKETYFAQLGPPEGNTEQVPLVPDEQDRTIVRSKLLYFIWDSRKRGAGDASR